MRRADTYRGNYLHGLRGRFAQEGGDKMLRRLFALAALVAAPLTHAVSLQDAQQQTMRPVYASLGGVRPATQSPATDKRIEVPDPAFRPTATAKATGYGVTHFEYDADGLMVGEILDPGTPEERRIRFTVDNANSPPAIFEESENGRVTRSYSWVGAELLQFTDHLPDGTNVTHFVQADDVGTVRALTDKHGNVTDTFEYDAFGNLIHRTGATDIRFRFRGQHFSDRTGTYQLRARWMDPTTGRFTQQDKWQGSSSRPATLHKYLYADADPVNNSDPSGYMTLRDVGMAATVGAILGATATPIYNHAIGRATTAGDVAMGATIGAGGGLAVLYGGPAVAIGLTGYGFGTTGAMTYDVYMNPGSTWDQKVAASALMLAAVAGPAYASRYAGQVWGGAGTRSLNDKRVLHDAKIPSLRAFWEGHGFKVCVECYVRNPHHLRGRRYDLIVRDTNGDYIGIEYKSTQWAVQNPPGRQVRADGWIEANGGEIFGASAEAAGFVGGSVTKVIRLGPDTAAYQ